MAILRIMNCRCCCRAHQRRPLLQCLAYAYKPTTKKRDWGRLRKMQTDGFQCKFLCIDDNVFV